MFEIMYYIICAVSFLTIILAFYNKKRLSRAILHFIAAIIFGVLALASFNIEIIKCYNTVTLANSTIEGLTYNQNDIICENNSYIDEANAWIFGSFSIIAILLSIVNMFTSLTGKGEEEE